jgi:hypothetical protein
MSQSKFVFKIRAVLVRIGSIIVTEMENVPAGFILLAPLRKVEKIFWDRYVVLAYNTLENVSVLIPYRP